MTRFSKSSLHRKASTGNVLRLLIHVGAVTMILGLINGVSSSSTGEVVTNPGIKGGTAAATIDLPKAAASATNNDKKETAALPPVVVKKEDLSKLAKKVFNEDPSDEGGNLASYTEAAGTETEYQFDTQHEIYHHYKSGGLAGAVIEDIFMCHAYAFHHNVTYGGICGDSDSLMVQNKELLASLGLGEKMPFKCPRDVRDKNDGIQRSVVQHSKCEEYGTRIWTPEYVSYLRSLVMLPEDETKKNNDNQHTIVAHVPRGSVTPCTKLKDGFQQYLPNLHYLNVIEKHKRPDSKVLIFSQETSHESLNDFSKKGYEVSHEDDLSAIWRAYVTADVAIMSRDDFSMIPSLVAQGLVVYTPMWHPPVKGWETLDTDIMELTNAETKRLQEACPEQ